MAFDSKFVRTPPPFAVRPVERGWFYDLRLQERLRGTIENAGLRNLGIAMVDLTGNWGRPMSYAGYNDERQLFAGSLPKIAIMLAAFRLREQVREAAKVLGIGDAKKLFNELANAWSPVIAREAHGRTADFPRLAEIFELQVDARKTDFNGEFLYRLDQMIAGIGSNSAAAYCASAMGFAYINGVLQMEGLQEGRMGTRGFKGLSLSLNYGGKSWASDGGPTAQGATAKAVAGFMTALHFRRLVSKEASEEMLGLMKRATSWFEDGLRQARRPAIRIFKKVGLLGGWSEGALIERQLEFVFYRYVAVVIGAPDLPRLWEAVVGIDALMEARY